MRIAHRLTAAADGVPMAMAVADKLKSCNDAENGWTAEDLHNRDGEVYEGTGALYACNERLCPNCIVKRSRDGRRRAREAIEKALSELPPSGELRFRLITLTMPTIPAARASVLLTLIVLNRAWRLFSRRAWYSAVVHGGIKGVEFTTGDKSKRDHFDAVQHGYHSHIHLLALSRWVEWLKLREEWTQCVVTAWAEHGVAVEINTSDGLAVCDVRLVTNRKVNHGRRISVEGAVNEVAKYVTPATSWLEIPDEQLLEVASIEKWPRMFETLGVCRERRNRARDVSNVSNDDVCDREVSVEERISALKDAGDIVKFADGRRHIELPWCRKGVWDDFALARHAEAELYVCGELGQRTLDALKARTVFLTQVHTQRLSVGGESRARPRARLKSLRKLGAEMLARGEVEKWRKFLNLHVENVRRFRISQLSTKYPCASFLTLAGFRFGRVRPFKLRAVA